MDNNSDHDERAAMAAIEALREMIGDAREQVAQADAARERYRGLLARDAWAWPDPWIDDEDRERTARLHAAQRTLAVLHAAVVAMRHRYGERAVGIDLGPDDDLPMRAVLRVAVPPRRRPPRGHPGRRGAAPGHAVAHPVRHA